SDSSLSAIFSFAADGDSSNFYMLYDCEVEGPNTLGLEIDSRYGRFGTFLNIAPEEVKAHNFAGCTDHISSEHWIYIGVVDTEPSQPERTLFFLRSTDYGNDWFPPVDSYPLSVRDPYLASGITKRIYFAACAGTTSNSLPICPSLTRSRPAEWVCNWINTGGDEIESPIIAVSFSPVCSLVVWCAYARNRNNSGNWDIEYVYSTDGGVNWSEPAILAGSLDAEERYFDLKPRRYENSDEVTLAYIVSTASKNTIFARTAHAFQPDVWSGPIPMNAHNAATDRNVRPKLCYHAQLPSVGPGVVYVTSDSPGCWWSANWPGIAEQPIKSKMPNGRFKVSPTIGIGPFRIIGVKSGEEITVTDISGRTVRRLCQPVWNGKDDKGRSLPAGVYIIRGNNTEVRTVILTAPHHPPKWKSSH
ncbi:MAG: hypothetical protein ABIK18_02255, partial [candidate division WOR-3 bacterium]